MEDREQKLFISVAYKSGVASQKPSWLIINSDEVILTSQPPDSYHSSDIIFSFKTSDLNKIALTPFNLILHRKGKSYALALSLSTARWLKGPGGKPDEFTLTQGFQKRQQLLTFFRTLGVQVKDYTFLILGAVILFLGICMFPLIF